jgi:ADP-ribose pyrophosphatase
MTETETLFNGRWLRLKRRGTWEYAERANPGGAVIVVAVTAEDEVVFVEQYRVPIMARTIEMPAGLIGDLHGHDHEDAVASAQRELEEETGYRAGRIVRTGRILTTPGFTDEVIHLFCAFDLSPGPTAHEPGELIEVREVRFDEAIEMVERGELIDAKSVAALHHAQRLRATGATAPGFP